MIKNSKIIFAQCCAIMNIFMSYDCTLSAYTKKNTYNIYSYNEWHSYGKSPYT